jgi:cytochrome c oxidase subunit 2
VDHLLYFLMAISVFFTLLIAFLVAYFAVRYRRRAPLESAADNRQTDTGHGGAFILEVAWTVIPFGLVMVMFAWGASVYFTIARPPDDAIQIWAVGKQWMWKIQHMEGQREINELHIPVDKAVKVTMTSEDVIHSFYVPAFRTKQDVLPGRYTTTWFKGTKPGKYHLFCAEYCGTKHSGMIGSVYVMEQKDYQAWLSGGTGEGSLASNGGKLFQDLACSNCHHLDGTQGRCPNLVNVFGSRVQLSNGSTVIADEAYIRESILSPSAKVVSGFEPVMPTFQGLVTEEGLLQLVEYIKSLGPKPGSEAAPTAAPQRLAPTGQVGATSMAGSTPGNR